MLGTRFKALHALSVLIIQYYELGIMKLLSLPVYRWQDLASDKVSLHRINWQSQD